MYIYIYIHNIVIIAGRIREGQMASLRFFHSWYPS